MHPRRQAQKGGATASAGPSPERRRPDTNYDSEILHLSVDILKKAADQFQQQENINSSAVTATQTLWRAATDEICPPDLLLPTLQAAQIAVNEAGDNHIQQPTATFRRAAAILQTIINTESEHESPNYRFRLVPDGRQRKSVILYWRDERVTGLRNADHRRARREARIRLKNNESGSAETVRGGKGRRYADHYGQYHL